MLLQGMCMISSSRPPIIVLFGHVLLIRAQISNSSQPKPPSNTLTYLHSSIPTQSNILFAYFSNVFLHSVSLPQL